MSPVVGLKTKASRSTVIRWGVAGTGRIADAVVRELDLVPGVECAAVGSRSTERAKAFAHQRGIGRAYGSYEALIADPEVNLIYVATPNSTHCALALASIRSGKAVLVEKAFTCTLAGAIQVVTEARMQNIFAMEAMWTRFHPAMVRAEAMISDGAIEVTSVQAVLRVAATSTRPTVYLRANWGEVPCSTWGLMSSPLPRCFLVGPNRYRQSVTSSETAWMHLLCCSSAGQTGAAPRSPRPCIAIWPPRYESLEVRGGSTSPRCSSTPAVLSCTEQTQIPSQSHCLLSAAVTPMN
jgi:Oxidoreductase family, NAD-binding Rossmann fold